MLPVEPQAVVDRLRDFQRAVRRQIVKCRLSADLHAVARAGEADTIYAIDAAVDPLMEEFCREWGRTTPLVLIAEGLQNHRGEETARVFPEGVAESDALIRVIMDPIDGTRGIMYDKRPAWTLAGVAPNRGPATGLRDIEVAVMTELPTSKMGAADILWAIRGRGARGVRTDLRNGAEDEGASPLRLRPSQADTINHGFAMVSNFFPATKVLASELMERLVKKLIGQDDITRATVFDDQYISTGGQFYELIAGHDRFNADLRPLFYKAQNVRGGMCCHPYDCAALLVAEEAGVIITDGFGRPLDAPMDTVSDVAWAGYANAGLRRQIEPLLMQFLREIGAVGGDATA